MFIFPRKIKQIQKNIKEDYFFIIELKYGLIFIRFRFGSGSSISSLDRDRVQVCRVRVGFGLKIFFSALVSDSWLIYYNEIFWFGLNPWVGFTKPDQHWTLSGSIGIFTYLKKNCRTHL